MKKTYITPAAEVVWIDVSCTLTEFSTGGTTESIGVENNPSGGSSTDSPQTDEGGTPWGD